MDTSMNIIATMATALSDLAMKGTADFIQNKIEASKAEKDTERIRNTYEEIINRLLSEREEAVRIAQFYKGELDRVVISDDDIKSLHKTVEDVVELLKVYTKNDSIEDFERMKNLVSVETLKTLQLLGFNFKVAIGEPLTEICANAIHGLGKAGKPNGKGR